MPAHATTPVTDYFRIDGLTHSYGDRRVLTDLSVVIDPSQRLGLIGENGAGKSTLLRIMAGMETPDAGDLSGPGRVGLLWQEVRFRPSDTLDALIEDALAEVRAIESELEEAASALGSDSRADQRYAAALDAAERAEVWTVDSRRDEILAGLGLADTPLTRRLDEVSGGQRSRFALAALLLSRPTALLLDEPTNHLDDAAAEFLERQLMRWKGPVVFASHDRQFLDDVATSLLDIDPSKSGARRFGGSRPTDSRGVCTDYLAEKSAERARWEAQFAEEQDELNRLKFSVDVTSREINHNRPINDNNKMGYDKRANKVQLQISRRVRNAQGRLDELTETQVRKPNALLNFAGIPHGSHALADGILVQASEVVVTARLDVPSVVVQPRSRVLVTGENGAGKSTLLSVLAGTLAPDSGRVNRRRGLRVQVLEQDVRIADPSMTPRAAYEKTMGERRAEALPLTSLGLIAPRDLDRPLGSLSIGQQRRFALAAIIAKPPHLFLLDEPTNHLSLSLATELEDALGSYPGAVIVASHDRWLRRRWTGETWAMSGGRMLHPIVQGAQWLRAPTGSERQVIDD
ncbi:ABC-F family ATP-binding cassette domain-containing protein [Glaciihabitans sp. UYNi722]|uniref:ABC-F family ATP-binding cassette domain-containing protein n=1 Tax=Glaciihabitans sp. UYNi722 TaxID=3156344 RepID=UPI003393A1E8